ncbi:hypothetical protein NBRC116494_30250 [Aurantivibrio plasticivorans]
MNYSTRRIAVSNEQGEEVEYSDDEFFAFDGPLVLLGEPGSGKSELLRYAGAKVGVEIYNASTLEALQNFESEESVVIVDGVDEVTAYGAGTPIAKVLKKLPSNVSFIISCRAADWQGVANATIINQKWKRHPVVGRIIPLNEQEIVDFVNSYGEGFNGREFVTQALNNDVLEMLGNPQYLLLFLKVVKINGWPKTKVELYENASRVLVGEHNEMHSSINPVRYSIEKLIEAAGFIFSQLILSGEICLGRSESESGKYVAIHSLDHTEYEPGLVGSAIASSLFRPVGINILEYCHRTMAEFLAAKWLANALNDKLSLWRLETILCSNNIVPSSLRGLHAWIATLNATVADRFIDRDPYGFFRYGDPSALSTYQSKNLLNNLRLTADQDPYFRDGDWAVGFGKGLAREELRCDIIELIRSPHTPFQLSHMVLESIKGDPFSDEIIDELLELVADGAATTMERQAAVHAISESNTQPNWVEVVENLRELADIESLRIALRIAQENINHFDGQLIGNIFVELAEAMSEENGASYVGLGWGIYGKMSADQLSGCLDVLTSLEKGVKKKLGAERKNYIDEWLFSTLEERFKRGALPSVEKIWSWLKPLDEFSYVRSSWDKYSITFFSNNLKIRRAIQAEAIVSCENPDRLWLGLFGLRAAASGLWMHESDLIYHLDWLLENKEQYPDWPSIWKVLVRWGGVNADFTGSYLKHAKNQASQNELLLSHIAELEKPPERDYKKEEEERQKVYGEKRRKKALARHERYKGMKEAIVKGEALGALYDVASTYLGRFSDFTSIKNPIDRIVELVGEEMASTAIEALSVAIQHNDIPSARKITELHTNESKEYFLESILLASCAIQLESKGDLSLLSIEMACSALASCHWGAHSYDDLSNGVQRELEGLVFQTREVKEVFLRDTVEPFIEKGSEHVPGLYRLSRDEEFADIGAKVAAEWLQDYPGMHASTSKELLAAVVRYGTCEQVKALVNHHVSKNNWHSDDHRNIWMGVAFLSSFDEYVDELTALVREEKDSIWSFRAVLGFASEESLVWSKPNAIQNYFLIVEFGSIWESVYRSNMESSGDKSRWDASEFVRSRINALASDLSDEAENLLGRLTIDDALAGYQDHLKHLYSQQTRNRAEANKRLPTLNDVRNILLRGEPCDHDDLQAILIDELDSLQERIRSSQTNDVRPYWSGETPHDENYCRDRIASSLNPYLERFNIRSHVEGAMPGDKRCDLLNTHGNMNLPIEIKGQWHSEIWRAAETQLHDYTNEYRSAGRGIYLVLWFGYLGPGMPKNPHGWTGQPMPKTLEEMKAVLAGRYKNISEKTKIFVLDLSM